MKYSVPSVHVLSSLRLIAESQYVVGITPGGDGCPDILFSKETGTGTINVVAAYSITANFSSGGPCTGTASTSGTAVFVNNELQVDCSSSELTCNFFCQNTSQPLGGTVCLTSLTLNGEPQDVTGICIDLDAAQFDFFMSNGPCD